MKIDELKPNFVLCIPDVLEHGILYISEEYGCSVHLCACGCGNKTVLPFKSVRDEMNWSIKNYNGLITFNPSIGNHQLPCKSHYYIVDNKIKWC